MYEHYIAVDWSQSIMAVARISAGDKDILTTEVAASVKELKVMLDNLKGTKILTLEEGPSSQWLYMELKSHVDELIVCDPYRNSLLKEGAKNDKIDSIKLLRLLKAGLLKPVFHSGDEFINLRKVVSAYNDMIQAGARTKNQRLAIYRSVGLSQKAKLPQVESFIVSGLDNSIKLYEDRRIEFENEFNKLSEKHKVIRQLQTIPGIGLIGAIKIISQVVDPKRFPTKGHFLSYCGLVKLDRSSGGKSYGKRNIRYSRTLKYVFKTAAMAVIRTNNKSVLHGYFKYLINEQNLVEYKARHAVARRIAVLTLGVLKNNKSFKPQKNWRLAIQN